MTTVVVSRCLSATGIRFSGHPNPARGVQLSSVGLPDTTLRCPDPVGVTTFHTREKRPGRVPPTSRGRRCSPGRVPSSTGACRISTASPYPLPTTIHRQGPLYETSTKVHAIHPSGLPLARGPRMERGPFGVPLSFTPCRYQQRMSERGRVSSTHPKLTQPKPIRPSYLRVVDGHVIGSGALSMIPQVNRPAGLGDVEGRSWRGRTWFA